MCVCLSFLTLAVCDWLFSWPIFAILNCWQLWAVPFFDFACERFRVFAVLILISTLICQCVGSLGFIASWASAFLFFLFMTKPRFGYHFCCTLLPNRLADTHTAQAPAFVRQIGAIQMYVYIHFFNYYWTLFEHCFLFMYTVHCHPSDSTVPVIYWTHYQMRLCVYGNKGNLCSLFSRDWIVSFSTTALLRYNQLNSRSELVSTEGRRIAPKLSTPIWTIQWTSLVSIKKWRWSSVGAVRGRPVQKAVRVSACGNKKRKRKREDWWYVTVHLMHTFAHRLRRCGKLYCCCYCVVSSSSRGKDLWYLSCFAGTGSAAAAVAVECRIADRKRCALKVKRADRAQRSKELSAASGNGGSHFSSLLPLGAQNVFGIGSRRRRRAPSLPLHSRHYYYCTCNSFGRC